MWMRVFALVVMTALISACGHMERSRDATSDSAHFRGVIAPNHAVSLEVAANIGADISVTGTGGQTVTLDAVPTNGFSGVKLTTSNEPQQLRLRLDSSASQSPRFRWFLQHHANATITLSVPRDSAVSIHGINGPVRIGGVHGPLEVHIVNGLIDVKDAGSVLSLHVVNGAIDASIDDLSRTPNVEIAGTNGSIDVTVPKDFRARVEAHTVFGPLEQSINDSQASGFVRLRLVAGPVSIREQ